MTLAQHSKSILVAISLFIFVSACGTDPFFAPDDFSTVPEAFSTEGATLIEKESGLVIYVLEEGFSEFTLTSRDDALIYYTGRKTNGEIFDSSYKNGITDPTAFRSLSRNSLTSTVPGFYEGVLGMKEGGKRVLVIPPSLGYGNDPNSELQNDTLVFDIELSRILD